MDEITPLYRTKLGAAFVCDSLEYLSRMEGSCVDLIITSPPFALLRQKSYGNVDEGQYVQWLKPFAHEVFRVLKDSGSFVLDLGGAYRPGIPSRSLYNFRVLVSLCDDIGFHLAEDFYWFNPAKLPSPIEWVNKRKIRVKDSVDTVWWFSKTPWPKADIKNVLVPYSERMQKLMSDPEGFFSEKKRPSGHEIKMTFARDNGGAIPPNLLSISNTDSNSAYLRLCKESGLGRHPARFPEGLPEFFIKMLTDYDDLVVDIFAGSNTTGHVAEKLERRWMAIDDNLGYLRASVLRFISEMSPSIISEIVEKLNDSDADLLLPSNEVPRLPLVG